VFGTDCADKKGDLVRHPLRLVTLVVCLLCATSVEGAVILVTTPEQIIGGGGGCSLEEAIYSANFDSNLAPGTYTDALDTVATLNATPNAGFSFLNWTGNVGDPNSATTAVIMGGPQTVTANFVAGDTLLGGNILTKSGPLNARVWPVNVANAASNPVTAHNAQITSLTLAQVAGAACTPVLGTALPVSAGDLAPGSSATVSLTIDFTGCATNARFTAQATFAANGGGATGSMTRTNQFP